MTTTEDESTERTKKEKETVELPCRGGFFGVDLSSVEGKREIY